MAREISGWILDLDEQFDVPCMSYDKEMQLAVNAVAMLLATPGVNLNIELQLLRSHTQQLKRFGKSYRGFAYVEEEISKRTTHH
jgi:hypothetical protein